MQEGKEMAVVKRNKSFNYGQIFNSEREVQGGVLEDAESRPGGYDKDEFRLVGAESHPDGYDKDEFHPAGAESHLDGYDEDEFGPEGVRFLEKVDQVLLAHPYVVYHVGWKIYWILLNCRR